MAHLHLRNDFGVTLGRIFISSPPTVALCRSTLKNQISQSAFLAFLPCSFCIEKSLLELSDFLIQICKTRFQVIILAQKILYFIRCIEQSLALYRIGRFMDYLIVLHGYLRLGYHILDRLIVFSVVSRLSFDLMQQLNAIHLEKSIYNMVYLCLKIGISFSFLILWKSYMFNCRTKDENFLCLKYFGKIQFQNNSLFLTMKQLPWSVHQII